MARNNRHNTAFVVGSVLGAVAGAAAALWKTPYTGEELRAKLTGAGSGDTTEARTLSTTPASVAPSTSVTAGDQRSIKDKVLSGVEKTLAPIVGVELGKTANGSGPLDSNIKVNKDVAGSNTSVSHAADGTQTIGLSQDRVDADKWAAAYAGNDTETEATPAASTAAESVTSTDSTSLQSRILRKAHDWRGDASATSGTHAGEESEKIGLSLDRVDAEKWAAAYAGTDTGSDTGPTTSDSQVTQPAAPSASTETASGQSGLLRHPHAWHGESAGASVTHAADGSAMIGLSRDKVDAEKWAAAYAGETVESTPDSTATSARETVDTTSKAAESASQTGLGSKPAFPGSDHIGHPPADNTAPDSSVADVGRGDDAGRTGELHSVSDAATIDQLTSPQTGRVPDSLRAPTDHAAHPFPKLGGHEN